MAGDQLAAHSSDDGQEAASTGRLDREHSQCVRRWQVILGSKLSALKTGPDGGGDATTFPSSLNSRRVAIEREDWNLAYCKAVFKSAIPADLKATWSVVPHFEDRPTLDFTAVTVAQGLSNGPHHLVLERESGSSAAL